MERQFQLTDHFMEVATELTEVIDFLRDSFDLPYESLLKVALTKEKAALYKLVENALTQELQEDYWYNKRQTPVEERFEFPLLPEPLLTIEFNLTAFELNYLVEVGFLAEIDPLANVKEMLDNILHNMGIRIPKGTIYKEVFDDGALISMGFEGHETLDMVYYRLQKHLKKERLEPERDYDDTEPLGA